MKCRKGKKEREKPHQYTCRPERLKGAEKAPRNVLCLSEQLFFWTRWYNCLYQSSLRGSRAPAGFASWFLGRLCWLEHSLWAISSAVRRLPDRMISQHGPESKSIRAGRELSERPWAPARSLLNRTGGVFWGLINKWWVNVTSYRHKLFFSFFAEPKPDRLQDAI